MVLLTPSSHDSTALARLATGFLGEGEGLAPEMMGGRGDGRRRLSCGIITYPGGCLGGVRGKCVGLRESRKEHVLVQPDGAARTQERPAESRIVGGENNATPPRVARAGPIEHWYRQ